MSTALTSQLFSSSCVRLSLSAISTWRAASRARLQKYMLVMHSGCPPGGLPCGYKVYAQWPRTVRMFHLQLPALLAPCLSAIESNHLQLHLLSMPIAGTALVGSVQRCQLACYDRYRLQSVTCHPQ